MLSAWIAEQGQHCTINIGLWQDNGRNEAPARGIFLADTIRHIANALQKQYGKPVPDSISAILELLHTELGHPTSDVQGGFSHGQG
jgi:hypothetical protein